MHEQIKTNSVKFGSENSIMSACPKHKSYRETHSTKKEIKDHSQAEINACISALVSLHNHLFYYFFCIFFCDFGHMSVSLCTMPSMSRGRPG